MNQIDNLIIVISFLDPMSHIIAPTNIKQSLNIVLNGYRLLFPGINIVADYKLKY